MASTIYVQSGWRTISRERVRAALAATEGKSEQEIRAALRDAYPFGMRKYHPYKIWLSEVAIQRGRKPVLGSRRNVHGKFVPINREPDPRQEVMFQ